MPETLKPGLIGELLALLAHDLRNPLSALHSNVSFVGSLIEPDNADAQEAIADSLLSCDGLTYIIDSMEVLSQVLTGQSSLETTGFNATTLLEEAQRSTIDLARSHEVTVEIDPKSLESRSRVIAHREMTARAFGALLRNSIQHAPPTSVVRLALEDAPQSCNLLVFDEGTALAPEAAEAAFTAAGQISTKGLRGGRYSRGLGLYCASVYAEAASASVAVLPLAGPGNAFQLRLPREPGG